MTCLPSASVNRSFQCCFSCATNDRMLLNIKLPKYVLRFVGGDLKIFAYQLSDTMIICCDYNDSFVVLPGIL